MGGTPTLNDSLPPKHRQFSLEDVEDHYLEWLEKWIAEIESGPARHMPRPIQVDTREPGLENRQRRKSLVGSNPTPSNSQSSIFGIHAKCNGRKSATTLEELGRPSRKVDDRHETPPRRCARLDRLVSDGTADLHACL
jgi:hypothetical protein